MKAFMRKVAVKIRKLLWPRRFEGLIKVKFFSLSEGAWYCEFFHWGQICSGLLFLPKEAGVRNQIIEARAVKFLQQGYWLLKLV